MFLPRQVHFNLSISPTTSVQDGAASVRSLCLSVCRLSVCLSVCLSVSLSLSLALSLRCSCKRDRLPAGSPHREPRRRPRKRRARVPAICGALRLNGGQRLPRKSKPQSVNTVSIQKQLCTGLYMIMTNYTMVYSLMIRNNYTNKGHNGSNLHTDSTLYTSF